MRSYRQRASLPGPLVGPRSRHLCTLSTGLIQGFESIEEASAAAGPRAARGALKPRCEDRTSTDLALSTVRRRAVDCGPAGRHRAGFGAGRASGARKRQSDRGIGQLSREMTRGRHLEGRGNRPARGADLPADGLPASCHSRNACHHVRSCTSGRQNLRSVCKIGPISQVAGRSPGLWPPGSFKERN